MVFTTVVKQKVDFATFCTLSLLLMRGHMLYMYIASVHLIRRLSGIDTVFFSFFTPGNHKFRWLCTSNCGFTYIFNVNLTIVHCAGYVISCCILNSHYDSTYVQIQRKAECSSGHAKDVQAVSTPVKLQQNYYYCVTNEITWKHNLI